MIRRPKALTGLAMALALAAGPRAMPGAQDPAPAFPPALPDPTATPEVPTSTPTQLPVPPESDPTGFPDLEPTPVDDPANPGGDDPFGPLEPAPEPEVVADGIPAPYDPEVIPAQDPPAVEVPDLGEAKMPPGGVQVPADAPSAGMPFVLRPTDIKPGPNSVDVVAEVRAEEVANLNHDGKFDIIVRNNGTAEATNVRVRYPKPDGVEFLSSEPAGTPLAEGDYLWQINSLPPKSQKVIKVDIRYTKEGEFDHVVTVHLQAGAKARTQARRPQLKVEVRPDRPDVLRGGRVGFNINVSNYGTFPAENVVVLAKLSPGLAHPSGQDVELPLQSVGKSVLAAGETVGPLRLEVDAQAEGPQSCTISVTSVDTPEAVQAVAEVEVVEPRLMATLDGPATRFPGTKGTYILTVKNDGTAPAQNVLAAIKVPPGGEPKHAEPTGYVWDERKRTIYWRLDHELPAKSSADPFKVEVLMGDVGSLPVTGGAKADNTPQDVHPLTTRIEGLPDVRCDVTEPRGVLDIGEETKYRIILTNQGSKDATNLAVTAQLSQQLEVLGVSGAGSSETSQSPTDGKAVLPTVPRLAPGGKVELTVKAKGVKAGQGSCQVEFMHDDLDSPLVGGSVVTRVVE